MWLRTEQILFSFTLRAVLLKMRQKQIRDKQTKNKWKRTRFLKHFCLSLFLYLCVCCDLKCVLFFHQLLAEAHEEYHKRRKGKTLLNLVVIGEFGNAYELFDQ